MKDNLNEGEKQLYEFLNAVKYPPGYLESVIIKYKGEIQFSSYTYEEDKFSCDYVEDVFIEDLENVEWLRPLPKSSISEQIAGYVHEIDSLLETNRKLGEKLAAAKPIDSEEIPDINELIKKFLPNQFVLSTFKPKEVLRLEAAFQQGAQVMFHTLKNRREESKNLDDSEEIETIGKIISEAILLHELNPSVVEKQLGFPKGVIGKLMNDEYYTVSVPVVLFKNLIQSLHISFSKIEMAMMPTFKLMLSKETSESIEKKSPHYSLWENEECLNKYLIRLREIFYPNQNQP